ncbi:MAG: formate dehydrogenase subunit gamma [Candidatus Eisenbacteria bacterium]|nr:formate dehydrogenase subunit gamma [Candidatus Eisenbacteria bacterium]
MAKKENSHPDEIDLTLFAYVQAGSREKWGKPGCGGCHPGGGAFEFDRDGQRYDRRLAAEPELAQSLDGDYYKSHWDRSGVVEADCFICHLPRYHFATRNWQLKHWNYKWATVAASGIGQVQGTVIDGEEPTVVYNERLFNEDGKIVLDLAYPPPSENCVFCHGMSDLKKRGFSWNDPQNHDVHNLAGIQCAHCHPSDLNHNFAKGDERVSTVADELDGTIRTCAECHQSGYMGATRPEHTSVRPNHLERLDCEFCHIPAVHRAGGAGFDVTTGGMVNFPKIGAPKIGAAFTWHPQYLRGEDGKLEPVNPLLGIIYTNLDTDGIYYPLFPREIKKAYRSIQAQLGERPSEQPVLVGRDDIALMLGALRGSLADNARFTQVDPHFHRGGQIYSLARDAQNRSGSSSGGASSDVVAEEDHTWVGHMEAFNINHNVAPASQALGADGCGDCHAGDSHVFRGAALVSLMTEDGDPAYTRRGRLFGCSPLAFALNTIHQQYLTPYVSLLIFLLIFFLLLHYTGQGPKMLRSDRDGEVQRFRLTERWTHLVRMLTFLLLWFTGAIFFYNAVGLLDIFFSSPQQAVVYHWVAGLIFLAASAVSFALWARDARWAPYDSEWLRKKGGYIGHEKYVPAGRLNAGQKVFFWISMWLSLLMGVSGVLLIWKTALPLSLSCFLSTLHGFLAILFVATIAVHAYLGTIANPGTWRALIDGKVSREWARKHHSVWYERIAAQSGGEAE